MIQVPAISVTATGKKMEVPARKIGSTCRRTRRPTATRWSNPQSLDAFAEYARTQQDYRTEG